MKIIDNCWKNVELIAATFGDHHFSKEVAEIYIKNGALWHPGDDHPIVTEEDILESEKKFVPLGACKLVFRNICQAFFRITPYIGVLSDRGEPIVLDYVFGEKNSSMSEFHFGINVKGNSGNFMLAGVYLIYAESFSLHIFED